MKCYFFALPFAQANNQWNIEAELGSDPMDSAFARALTSGIKGVAMVLDQEVQPLTSDLTDKFRGDNASNSPSGVKIANFRSNSLEECGAYSNSSCPAVSSWIWFSPPTPVCWVMLLGTIQEFCCQLKPFQSLPAGSSPGELVDQVNENLMLDDFGSI